jgi:flagellar hook-associated protein 1 FlgK
MGGILTSMLNSARALQVFDRQLNAIQNNVTNANTPGYVRQTQTVMAMTFDPARHLPGGTLAGPLLSARSDYLEQSVWRENQSLGYAAQRVADLELAERHFDLGGSSGIPAALVGFFQSYSQLSIKPNDALSRQMVLEKAGMVAQSFRQTAYGLSGVLNDLDRQARDVVSAINRVVGQLRTINETRRKLGHHSHDAGVESQVYAKLEELSALADFQAIQAEDGTFTLFLGGQTPLLIGDTQYPLTLDLSATQTRIIDAQGADATGMVGSGRLAALLNEKNTLLPRYVDQLNTLAMAFADAVNEQHAAGLDRFGAAPVTPLFTYDSLVGAAFTISVSPITPDEVTAALVSAPGGNGNAIALSRLAAAPAVSGVSFTEFYGNLAGRVGRDLMAARDYRGVQASLLAQARDLRSAETGVSLDLEAVHLIQVQRAYQATGKLVSVLNELTETILGILR